MFSLIKQAFNVLLNFSKSLARDRTKCLINQALIDLLLLI